MKKNMGEISFVPIIAEVAFLEQHWSKLFTGSIKARRLFFFKKMKIQRPCMKNSCKNFRALKNVQAAQRIFGKN